jgi:hypothetical protein
MDEVVEDMIVLIAVVILGLVIASFAFSYFAPKIAFANAESLSNTMASSMSVSNGPLILGNNGEGSILVEAYNPSFTGNYTIVAFTEPSSLSSAVGLVTPSSSSLTKGAFQVYLPSGKSANAVQLPEVYSLSGAVLLGQGSGYGYTVPANTPFTVDLPANAHDIVVIWLLYQEDGFCFRVDYTYSGVPS